MAKGKKRNRGWFRKGHDPRRRAGFTPEECQRGHAAALEKMVAKGVHAHAWFFRRIRGWYRKKRREHGTQEEDRPGPHFGPAGTPAGCEWDPGDPGEPPR